MLELRRKQGNRINSIDGSVPYYNNELKPYYDVAENLYPIILEAYQKNLMIFLKMTLFRFTKF